MGKWDTPQAFFKWRSPRLFRKRPAIPPLIAAWILGSCWHGESGTSIDSGEASDCGINFGARRERVSVSRVARAEGVNSHQVFNWRRAYRDGRLVEPGTSGLLPVVIAGADTEKRHTQSWPPGHSCGSIHIEIPERALISVEPGVDSALLRTVLELLRK